MRAFAIPLIVGSIGILCMLIAIIGHFAPFESMRSATPQQGKLQANTPPLEVKKIASAKDAQPSVPVNTHNTMQAFHLALLVLDLEGNGIRLTEPETHEIYMSNYPSEPAGGVGWVHPDNGILARGLEAKSNILDVEALLGSRHIDGFTELSYLEAIESSTIDRRINKADGVLFASLQVWQDKNVNAMVDPGELFSLRDLGIIDIDIRAMPQKLESRWIESNKIGFQSRFLRANGEQGQIAHVLLKQKRESQRRHPLGYYHRQTENYKWPQHRGHGALDSWQVVMERDAVFSGMVQRFAKTKDFSRIDEDIEEIMLRWAGVQDVPPDSRGEYIDARILAFLEQYNNEPYYHVTGGADPFHPEQAAQLMKIWGLIFDKVRARALAQGPLADVFPSTSYNYNSGAVLLRKDYNWLYHSYCHAEKLADADYAASVEHVLVHKAKQLKKDAAQLRQDVADCRAAVLQSANP
jgi:hypothetical protein